MGSVLIIFSDHKFESRTRNKAGFHKNSIGSGSIFNKNVVIFNFELVKLGLYEQNHLLKVKLFNFEIKTHVFLPYFLYSNTVDGYTVS